MMIAPDGLDRAMIFRVKYRHRSVARRMAVTYGHYALGRLQDAETPVTPLGYTNAVEDAVMFARMAYRAWSAYRTWN